METLDLDQLAPEPRKVKIDGKIIDVMPLRLKNLIEMQRLFLTANTFEGDAEAQINAMAKIIEVLRPVVPQIDEIDFTLEQLGALLEFAGSTSEVKKGAQNPTSDSQ